MDKIKTKNPEWLSKLRPYEEPSIGKAMIQIVTSVVSYLGLMTVMLLLLSSEYPYWMILLLAIVTAGFYTRVFIIFHDCCHFSFFNSRTACAVLGNICGILTFTSYNDWQRSHNLHHATVSNLDRRGTGDVWTMTVKEYESSSKLIRFQYRIMRNPLFLFGFAPAFLFLILNRFPGSYSRKKEIIHLILTNLILAGLIALLYFTIGIKNYLMVQVPVTLVGSTFGMWLFYIQHQYQDVYWAHEEDWDLFRAAMEGSSFYKLQAFLRWLSGNIGYHHIHHLRPKIPNYNLKKCYDEIKELQEITPITLLASFKSLNLRLWDEATGKLVSFSMLKNRSGINT
jgi:omega-6 fatty acid desaturase (delta-12 desaturase)